MGVLKMPAQAKRGKVAPKGKKSKKTVLVKYSIDCSRPCDQNIFTPESFTWVLQSKIKVNNGKAGKLGDSVKVTSEAAKVSVQAHAPFSKRYLKYLTKKFLKKNQLRDWLRVVATSKTDYTLKYFDIYDNDGEEASAEN